MITVNDISVNFGGTTLLVMFLLINENDKIALMGKNGAESLHYQKLLRDKVSLSTGSVSAPKKKLL
jgi:ATP-binding cassette subfamily F protein 3